MDCSKFLNNLNPKILMQICRRIVFYDRTTVNHFPHIYGDVKYVPYKTIRTDALFIIEPLNDKEVMLDTYGFKSFFPQKMFLEEGLDKISLTIKLDYVNEDSYLLRTMKNGPVTLRKYANYVHISIHREYINLSENLLDQVLKVIWNLLMLGLFKIPINKKIYLHYSSKLLVENDIHDAKEIATIHDFFQVIVDNLSLNTIEVFYDFRREGSIHNLFNLSQFIHCESTLYSKDYKVYDSNKSVRKSLLCIYNKSNQMMKKKRVFFDKHVTRLEFRLYKSFSRKLFSSIELLDGNYKTFLEKIQSQLIKKIQKLDIDFSRFIETYDIPKSLYSVLAGDNSHSLSDSNLDLSEGAESDCRTNKIRFLFFHHVANINKWHNGFKIQLFEKMRQLVPQSLCCVIKMFGSMLNHVSRVRGP